MCNPCFYPLLAERVEVCSYHVHLRVSLVLIAEHSFEIPRVVVSQLIVRARLMEMLHRVFVCFPGCSLFFRSYFLCFCIWSTRRRGDSIFLWSWKRNCFRKDCEHRHKRGEKGEDSHAVVQGTWNRCIMEGCSVGGAASTKRILAVLSHTRFTKC